MSRKAPKVLWFLAAVLSVYLAAPFVAGVSEAGIANWRSVDAGSLAAASLVSLSSATLATLLVTIGGAPLGYLLARTPGRGMRTLGFLVQLPLALPPLASGVLLLFLLGYSSPLGRWTNGALTDSFVGVVLAESFVAAPFLIIAARSAFAEIDPTLEDVASTLGHGPWSIFRRVSAPLASRAILAGMLLAWLRAFGEFGATVMVAYHPYSLPVYTYVAFGGEGLPAMMPILAPTLLAAIVVMIISVRLTRPTALRAQRPSPDEPGPAAAPGRGRFKSERRASSLSFAFRKTLPGFDLHVSWETNARRLAVLGASGSGKSMTLRLIAGLERAAAQRLVVGESDLSWSAPYERALAYVPQSFALFPHLSVADQVRFPIGADTGAARLWIERLGLTGLEQRRPSELSLGQQQRVALARGLCRPADLILLDEPFSALDAPLKAGLRRELRALQEEIDATTILVTHDPQEALELADELMILNEGHVLQVGHADDVFSRPADERVARLVGAENVASGAAAGPRTIEVTGGEWLEVAGPALTPGQALGWAVRADRIHVAPDGRYAGRILWRERPHAGACRIGVLFGECVLEMMADADDEPSGACRFNITPAAIQVWPLDPARSKVRVERRPASGTLDRLA